MNGTVVGIDIGATGIRGVEASTRGRSLQVHRAGAVPLPSGAVDGGVIQDQGAVSTALRTLFHKNHFGTKKVATVIGAEPAVLIRHAEITYLASETDRNGVVAEKAPEILPVEADKMYLGHHVTSVRPMAREDGSKYDVADIALVAADRACVDALIGAIEGAGLQPVSIDVTAFALTRFVAMAASGPGHLDVIAHIGAHTISLIGVNAGQPAFQRAMNDFSGAKVTGAIQETLRCSSEVAEQLKLDVMTVQGPEAAVVNEVVATWTNATVGALKTALVEASRQSAAPIGRVWLSGGGARLATLVPQLKARLGQGTQVAILDPATWVSKPDRLVRAIQSTGQDFTVALAASSR